MRLLLCCSLNGEIDEDELAIVQYMDCLAPLDEADETLKCLCLQWLTSGSAEEEKDAKRAEEEKELLAPG